MKGACEMLIATTAIAAGAFVLGIFVGRGERDVSAITARTAKLNVDTIASLERTVVLMQQVVDARSAQLIVARRHAMRLEAFVDNCHPMVSLS